MSTQKQQVIDNWQDEVTQPQPKPQPIPVISPQQPKPLPQQKQPKQTFKQKIQQYRLMTLDLFNSKYSDHNIQYKKYNQISGNKILKSNQDFILFAQLIYSKISQHLGPEDLIDDQSIAIFIQQLTLYLYSGLNWQNLFEISKKVKVLKNQRKTDQKKIKKQKNKKNKQKLDDQQNKVIQKQTIQQDDLFAGVATMTSKEQQDLRKKKNNKKQQHHQQISKPVTPAHDEDDDFM